MLIWILGYPGTGKTLLMCIIAFMFKNIPIYANFKLKFPIDDYNVNPLSPEMLLEENESVTERLLLADEIYSFADSRLSSNLYSILFSYESFQSRKRGDVLIISSQITRAVDIRLREMSDIVIQSNRDERGFLYTIYNKRSFRSKSLRVSFEKAKSFYPLYNTHEVIVSNNIRRIMGKTEMLENYDETVKKHKSLCSAFIKEKGYPINKDAIRAYINHNPKSPKSPEFVSALFLELSPPKKLKQDKKV
jgi:hypothetical protein